MNAREKPSPAGLVMAMLNGIGAVLILLMTVLICADILARNLFGQPVAGVAELGPVYTIFTAPVRPQTAPIKARGA